MKKRVSVIKVHKQWKQARKRFFTTLAAGQTAANLNEDEAARLAAEAVQAVRSRHPSGG